MKDVTTKRGFGAAGFTGLVVVCVSTISMISLVSLVSMGGCRDLQKRRVDIKQASGADQDLQNRFGLTADAQDPSERDKELGYGRWKQKPEPQGTSSPTDPARRKPIGSP